MKCRIHRSAAFTLLEILVALAILSIMMAFLFSMIGSGTRLWETGNKRIEATQAARVGLNTIERELRQAFAGSVTTYKSDGTAVQNTAPFEAIDTPSETDTLGLGNGAENAEGSQQLRAVVSTGDPNDPYKEIGLMCVHRGGASDDAMEPGRYYLVLKFLPATLPPGAQKMDPGQFFMQGPGTWNSSGREENFIPLIDNCIRLTFRYYGIEAPQNPADPDYDPDDEANKPAWSSGWSPNNRLPLGVLVTITVLDSRTAEKVKAVTGGSALSANDIDAGIAAAQGQGAANSNLQRLIAQGAVTMSRFIPLNKR